MHKNEVGGKYEKKIAVDTKENPKKVYAYMNSKVKTKQGIGDICVDPDNPKSKVKRRQIFSIFSKSKKPLSPSPVQLLENTSILST